MTFFVGVHTGVEIAIGEVRKLLRIGGVGDFNICCPGGGWRSLRSLRVGARGRAIHVSPTPPPPAHLHRP